MKRKFLLLAAGLLPLAAPAPAQTPSDVRCLMVSNLFANSGQGAKVTEMAEAGKYFYLGLVQGRFTDPQLKAAIAAELKSLEGVQAGPIMRQCMQRVVTKATGFEALRRQAQPAK